jgi:hypothetical protein
MKPFRKEMPVNLDDITSMKGKDGKSIAIA